MEGREVVVGREGAASVLLSWQLSGCGKEGSNLCWLGSQLGPRYLPGLPGRTTLAPLLQWGGGVVCVGPVQGLLSLLCPSCQEPAECRGEVSGIVEEPHAGRRTWISVLPPMTSCGTLGELPTSWSPNLFRNWGNGASLAGLMRDGGHEGRGRG